MSANPSCKEIAASVAMLHERIIGAASEFPDPPHRFTKDLLTFLGWSREKYDGFFVCRAKTSRDTVADIILSAGAGHCRTEYIPKITHKIWVTDPADPRLPPEEFVVSYCENLLVFPRGWAHIFWSNSDAVKEHIRKFATKYEVSVLICNVSDLPVNTPVKSALSLVADRKFVLATDVLRMVVVNHLGGLYSDFGITFRTVVPGITSLHEYCLVFVHDLFFQSSVVGAGPNSDLVSIFLAIISHPEALDRRYAVGASSDGLEAIHEVEMLAGLGWTACCVLFLPERVTQAYVYAGGEIEWRGLRSWYTEGGKLGNVLIHHTQPTVVQDENFERYSLDARAQIAGEHITDSVLREKLIILLKTRGYFVDNPTRLCRLIDYYCPEKGDTRRRYSYVLNYILWGFVDMAPDIIDFTIQCDGLWSDFFRGCHALIPTDDMEGSTKQFNLVIDSAHRHHDRIFPAVIDALDLVKKGGFYVLEDVSREQSDLFVHAAQFDISYIVFKDDPLRLDGDKLVLICVAP